MSNTFFINENPYKDTDNIKKSVIDIFHKNGYNLSSPDLANIAISIGGDGTFIDTAREAVKANIIGINKGTLGYLTEVEENDTTKAILDYINGNYIVEERMRIECLRDGCTPLSALNDVVVSKRNSSVIDVEIIVDNIPVTKYYADGVIVSTPTGITGYAFSCGAPIIDPNSEMMIITPVAPHTIMNRSICVSANSDIEIKLLGARNDSGCNLDIDGVKYNMSINESIHIKKSILTTKIVKFSRTSFLDRITSKMK